MQLLHVYGLGVPLGLLAGTLLARGGRNPLPVLLRAGRRAVTTPGGRALLGLVGLVLAIVLVQGLVDPRISHALGYDLTARIAGLEGDLVARVQAATPAAAVRPLAWFYMAGYVVTLLLPVVVWNGTSELDRLEPGSADRATTAYALGFLANIVLALPFYVFFPVQEVGWSGLSAAHPLLEQVWPGVTHELRLGSALDNCFPSLHVSCTVTALVVCFRHAAPGLRRVVAVLTLATAYAVLALGVHWALDVVAGVPFGVLCAELGERLAPHVPRHTKAGD